MDTIALFYRRELFYSWNVLYGVLQEDGWCSGHRAYEAINQIEADCPKFRFSMTASDKGKIVCKGANREFFPQAAPYSMVIASNVEIYYDIILISIVNTKEFATNWPFID